MEINIEPRRSHSGAQTEPGRNYKILSLFHQHFNICKLIIEVTETFKYVSIEYIFFAKSR